MRTTTPLVRRAVAAAAAAATGLVLTGSAHAGESTFNTARVKSVADGDTPYVDIAGDGITTTYPVRMTGVQTTEIRHPDINGNMGSGKDWCHGIPAKNRLSALTNGKLVQLRGVHSSSSSNGRMLRAVFVEDGDGGWRDVQRTMLWEGHALWMPQTVETTHNVEYHRLADMAAAAGRNIWDKDFCGVGPSQGAHLSMLVHYDANGDDSENLNGEYVVIKNTNKPCQFLDYKKKKNGACGPVDLSGWHLRDSSLEMYTFPAGSVLGIGKRFYVHVGKGHKRSTSWSTSFYMGRDHPLFDNAATNGEGDGAYLLDPQGDFRNWMTYPCVYSCSDPMTGKLSITKIVYNPSGADTAANEYVQIKNVSSSRVWLDGYLIRTAPYTMQPGWGTYLDRGETLTVSMGTGNPSRLRQYMGQSHPVLNNSGDEIDIVTYDSIHIACKTWGSGRCPAY